MVTSAGNAVASATPREEADGTATVSDERIHTIAAHGDLVLRVEHDSKASSPAEACYFRVESTILKRNSKYFERLLTPGRFGEGTDIQAKQRALSERYGKMADVPSDQLPEADIKDLGRISKIGSIRNLFVDFLYVLHGGDIQAFPPVANLANLAIVADRFDALETVAAYVRRKKIIRTIDGKTAPKQDINLSEDKVRQRVLVALMLDYPPWLAKYSARMVAQGWVGKEADTSVALWWDLPYRIEEELAYRRECTLDTIQSLQTYFLGMYTARERQCKLGYDSSAQCDSFQLGEMVRFFTRMNTLQFQGKLLDTNDPPDAFSGHLYNILETLRQIPEYQIDTNHKHCGVRTRLIPLLDLVEELLPSTGICADCWTRNRAAYAWIDAKRPLLWNKPRSSRSAVRRPCDDDHAHVRDLFNAQQRNWSGVSEGVSVLIANHASPMQLLKSV